MPGAGERQDESDMFIPSTRRVHLRDIDLCWTSDMVLPWLCAVSFSNYNAIGETFEYVQALHTYDGQLDMLLLEAVG